MCYHNYCTASTRKFIRPAASPISRDLTIAECSLTATIAEVARAPAISVRRATITEARSTTRVAGHATTRSVRP